MPWIGMPGGGVAHVRMSRRKPSPCSVCRARPHTRLCDGRRATGRTCDRKLCDTCTAHRPPDFDLCPECTDIHQAIQLNLFEDANAR